MMRFFFSFSIQDVALASVSMRPTPIAPVWEKLSLSDAKYGSVQRFYIKTQEDCALPSLLQEIIISSNPPEQVFQLKGSDHSPFFSKPQSLHRLLVEISKIPPKRVWSACAHSDDGNIGFTHSKQQQFGRASNNPNGSFMIICTHILFPTSPQTYLYLYFCSQNVSSSV